MKGDWKIIQNIKASMTLSPAGKLSCNKTALKRCISIDIHWRGKFNSYYYWQNSMQSFVLFLPWDCALSRKLRSTDWQLNQHATIRIDPHALKSIMRLYSNNGNAFNRHSIFIRTGWAIFKVYNPCIYWRRKAFNIPDFSALYRE